MKLSEIRVCGIIIRVSGGRVQAEAANQPSSAFKKPWDTPRLFVYAVWAKFRRATTSLRITPCGKAVAGEDMADGAVAAHALDGLAQAPG